MSLCLLYLAYIIAESVVCVFNGLYYSVWEVMRLISPQHFLQARKARERLEG